MYTIVQCSWYFDAVVIVAVANNSGRVQVEAVF
jgi:hypothetical protein